MKTAVLKGINKFEIIETPTPKLEKDTDVLIRIKMVGVCGSDLHYYSTGRIGSQIVNYPFIVGHEAAGIVEKVGSKVTRVKAGQRVAIDPAIFCGKCDQCLAGRENTCRDLIFMGNPGEREGAMAEYIVHDEKSCFPLENDITFEQAVLSEPLAIAVYAVDQSKIKSGASAAILGAGPVGMSVFNILRTKNVGNVYVTDKIPYRVENAKKLNPAWAGNPDEDNVIAEIRKHEPGSLDVVYECTGDPDIYSQAIKILKPGGLLAIIGIPEVDEISLPVHEMRRNEITVLNIRRQADCTERALKLIENKQVNIDGLVTHHFPIEKVQQAFELVSKYEDGVMKAMVVID